MSARAEVPDANAIMAELENARRRGDDEEARRLQVAYDNAMAQVEHVLQAAADDRRPAVRGGPPIGDAAETDYRTEQES